MQENYKIDYSYLSWQRVLNQYARINANLMKLRYELPEIRAEEWAGEESEMPVPIPDDFTLSPPDGHMKHDDLTPLIKIVGAIKPRVIVEIGTAYGNLTANLCRQFPQALVYTVNPPADQQTGGLVTFSLSADEIGRVYRAYGYSDRVVQIYANSLHLDLAEFFDQPMVDLAVIDGCHDIEYVLNDFFKIQPFVRQGGMIFIHDTHPSLRVHLVYGYKACMLLRQRGFNVAHVQGSWWGLWVNN